MFYFKSFFAFCMSINKNVLEWFLLIICKEHTLLRSTNLFSRNHRKLVIFMITKKRSVDAQYWTVTLPNWQKQPPQAFYKKIVLKTFAMFTRKHLCRSLFFNFIKKRLQHSCCKIFKNIHFEEHLHMAASELSLESDCLELYFLQFLSKPSLLGNITKISVAFKPEL